MLRARGTTIDDERNERLEALVAAAVADQDGDAWRQLWAELEPLLLTYVRRPRISGPLSESEDECRNIVTEVMARLRDDRYRRLELYLAAREQKPGLGFLPWLKVVTRRVAVDYRRAHDLYLDRRAEPGASAAGKWVVPGSLPADSRLGGERPPVTRRGTAREMLSYAGDNLPPDQRRALELWIQGATYDEIAAALPVATPRDAGRLVRAGLERLRRHFRDQDAR